MKYLPLYYQWINDGKLTGSGLCKSFKDVGLRYFHLDEHFFVEGDRAKVAEFWGVSKIHEFNGVRQNIVLLLAAMNNEL